MLITPAFVVTLDTISVKADQHLRVLKRTEMSETCAALINIATALIILINITKKHKVCDINTLI